MQNPQTTLAVPSVLIPGDIRYAVNLTVNTYIKSGFSPSAAIELADPVYPQRLYSGFRSIEAQDPVDVDTIYRLASMSKMITAITVLQYEEESCLCLDDRVSQYIPAFANARVLLPTVPTVYQFSSLEAESGSSLAVIALPYLAPNELNKMHKRDAGIQLAAPLAGVNVDGILKIVSFSQQDKTVTVQLNSASSVSGLFAVNGSLDVLPKLKSK